MSCLIYCEFATPAAAMSLWAFSNERSWSGCWNYNRRKRNWSAIASHALDTQSLSLRHLHPSTNVSTWSLDQTLLLAGGSERGNRNGIQDAVLTGEVVYICERGLPGCTSTGRKLSKQYSHPINHTSSHRLLQVTKTSFSLKPRRSHLVRA